MDTFLRWNGLQEADVQRWNAEMRAGIPGVAPEGLALHTNNGGRMKGAAMPPASASGSSRLSRVQASAMTTSSRKPFVQSPENRQIPQEKPFETAEDFQAWVDGLTTCQNGDHFSSPIRPPRMSDTSAGRRKSC